MKIESKIKMVEVPYDIYIASDGKEFESKNDCLQYEDKQKHTLKDCWDNCIRKIEVEPMTLGYSYDSEDYYDYVFVPRCEMDIGVLNGLMKWFGNVWYGKEFTADDIGKKYIAVLEYTDDIMMADTYFIDYDELWDSISKTRAKIEAEFQD